MPSACGLPGAEIARRALRAHFIESCFAATIALALPSPARAMQLADGVLPLQATAAWDLLCRITDPEVPRPSHAVTHLTNPSRRTPAT